MSSNTLSMESPQATTLWEIDPLHARAEFTVRHLMIANVRGTISIKRATITRDESDITRSRVEAELDVASIATGAADRDNHLRSADFFDVAQHPTMIFLSTRIERVDGGLRVHGDLTIRGATRPIVLEVEILGETTDPWGKTRAGAIATTTFDRRDFGLTWNHAIEAGGVLVGDKVKVTIDLEALRQ